MCRKLVQSGSVLCMDTIGKLCSWKCICLFLFQFKQYREERILNDRLAVLKKKSSLEMLSLIPEYRSRKKVSFLMSARLDRVNKRKHNH